MFERSKKSKRAELTGKKVTLEQFRKTLQCAAHEPAIDSNGIISLMKLIPVSR
jgi:hypothetical protein